MNDEQQAAYEADHDWHEFEPIDGDPYHERCMCGLVRSVIDRDVPKLVATPARVRFLSCEPLMEEVSFRWATWHPVHNSNHLDGLRMLDWIIVGGESGRDPRPMAQQWVEKIRAECAEAGVPFFMKQGSQANWPAYKDFSRFGDSIRVREWPSRSL